MNLHDIPHPVDHELYLIALGMNGYEETHQDSWIYRVRRTGYQIEYNRTLWGPNWYTLTPNDITYFKTQGENRARTPR